MSEFLEHLCKQAAELFEKEKYADIIGLLNDEVLKRYQSADLYAWRARAHSRKDDSFEKIIHFAQKAVDADPGYYMGFFARGCCWSKMDEYDKAIADYTKAIELKPDFADAYNNRGITWRDKGEYSKAIADYNKAIELKPHDASVYFNRGLAWKSQNEFDKAIADYNKAIDLKPDFSQAYTNRGIVWRRKGEYEKSIKDFNKALVLKPDLALTYFNRGLTFRNNKKSFANAIHDFNKFIELANEKDYIQVKRAKDFIEELHEKEKDPALTEISDIVSKIKKLLLTSDGCVTHYTGLSVAKKLLFDDSTFRISEGSFLNDTSEGRELFNFLGYPLTTDYKDAKTTATFISKPFIGSFVAESKHDDLNLWRFYGKESNVEAKGCSITIRMKEFVDAINSSLTTDRQKSDPNAESDIKFYRVVYWDHNSSTPNFHIPNSDKDVETLLNKLMGELKDKVQNYQVSDKSIFETYLNSIAFLFKSDAYKNENEIRIVVKGVEFEKKFDMEVTPPRVYIELVSIRPLIETITLGPKVDKPDEWAAAIYFSYDKELDDKKKPRKIQISRLPYK